MDTELLKSIFLKSKDRYEQATRWAFLCIALCVALHVLTFSQFVRFGKQLAVAENQVKQFTATQATVAEAESKLLALEKTLVKAVEDQMAWVLDNLIQDFQVLNETVDQNRMGLEPARSPLQSLRSSPLQFQEPQKDTSPLIIRDEQLKEQIQQAPNIEEIRELLSPFIEENILQPRFQELNDTWQKRILPNILDQTDELLQIFQTTMPFDARDHAVWNGIEDNIEEITTVAKDISFQAPSGDPQWWTTVSGKGERVANIEENAVQLFTSLIESNELRTLNRRISNALMQRKTLQDNVEAQLTRIRDTFEKQQQHLNQLGAPFQFAAMDITFLVSNFPLLLGVMLGAVTIWPVHRLWETAWNAHLLVTYDQTILPQEWFWGQIGYARTQESQILSRAIMEGIGWTMMFCVWLGIAAWELQGWEPVDANRLTALTIGGLIAIIASQAYRIMIIHRILGLQKAVNL
jgi:hypothetical protein